WQELVQDDWRAESVASTELVVVVGRDRETHLSTQYYANNAPPVRRYKYELEVRVLAARTGDVLGRNRFISTPRPIRPGEAWELTKIGQPVSFKTVYDWVTTQAKAGFPR